MELCQKCLDEYIKKEKEEFVNFLKPTYPTFTLPPHFHCHHKKEGQIQYEFHEEKKCVCKEPDFLEVQYYFKDGGTSRITKSQFCPKCGRKLNA